MTLLEIVNKVLRKLREDQVSDLTDDYSALIAEFVVDAHKIVVDAHDWTSMNSSVTLTVNTGQTSYGAYSGSADLYAGSAYPNQESQIIYAENDLPLAYLYDAYADIATGDPLHQMKQGDYRWVARQLNERVGSTARPSAFSIVQDAANDGWTVKLDSDPDATYYLNIEFFKPEVIADATDETTVIRAPWYPIYLGAVYFALNERGEELGEPGNTAEMKFSAALAAAKESDLLHQIKTNRFEFYRD